MAVGKKSKPHCYYDCLIAGKTPCSCGICHGKSHGSWLGIAAKITSPNKAA